MGKMQLVKAPGKWVLFCFPVSGVTRRCPREAPFFSCGLGPILVTSFYLNHFFKDPISKYSYILRHWGSAPQNMKFGWRVAYTIQPIILPISAV